MSDPAPSSEPGARTSPRTAPTAVPRRRRSRKGTPWPLERRRPGLLPFVVDALRTMYGEPTWVAPRHDPVDELVLTILSQHTSDLNAERAYRDLRARYATWDEVEHAPLEELRAAIVRAGLAIQKAPRIQAALWHIREHAGGYSLEFLREMEPLDARAWLTAIPGTGVKTASVVLLFCFDMPLSPVDTHVDRVSRRIGMIGPNVDVVAAHDRFLEFTPPELAYELHVNLITHGRQTCTALRPKCGRCAVAPRCRYVDPRAP